MAAAGIAFALLTALSYAAMSILVRKGIDRADADQGVLVALLINVILHGTIVASRTAWGIPLDGRTQGIIWFAVSGVLTTLLGRVALYGGIRRIGSSRAAALKNLSPFITVAGALLFLGERLTTVAGAGVAIALASYLLFLVEGYRRGRAVSAEARAPVAQASTGAAAATDEPVVVDRPVAVRDVAPAPPASVNRLSVLVIGYLSATAAAAFYGAGTVIRKSGLDAFPDPFFGAFVSASAGLVVYLLYLASRSNLRASVRALTTERNPYFIYAGVASTVGQLTLFIALSLTAVSYVSVVSSSDTLLTLFLAAAFLGKSEALNRLVIVAAAGVFVGTVLILVG